MAYTADDLRKMRERGTTRASSSDSKRKYTADDLMAMRGKSAQNETTSLYDSYAKQAVQIRLNTGTIHSNSTTQHSRSQSPRMTLQSVSQTQALTHSMH